MKVYPFLAQRNSLRPDNGQMKWYERDNDHLYSASLFLPVDTTNMLHMIQFLSTFIYKSNHNQYCCKASRKPLKNIYLSKFCIIIIVYLYIAPKDADIDTISAFFVALKTFISWDFPGFSRLGISLENRETTLESRQYQNGKLFPVWVLSFPFWYSKLA